MGFALSSIVTLVDHNTFLKWKYHLQEIFRAGSSFGVDRKMGQACYASLQGNTASCKKKRRRLVLSLQKTVVIQSYHWAQSESHTAGVKAPWWAHRATTQVGAKFCNMRETYQVALLGLYRGYWWYISSLPCERTAVQREAPPNSSGNLAQCVCKITLSKKNCGLSEKNWWTIIGIFYLLFEFKFLSPFLYCTENGIFCLRRAPRAYSNINIEFVYIPFFVNKYKSF